MRKSFSHETIIDENTKIFEFECHEDINIEAISENLSLAFIIRKDNPPQYISNPEKGIAKKGDYVVVVTLDADAERNLESKILK